LSYVGVILLIYSENKPIARKSETNNIKGPFFIEEAALMLN